MVGEVDNPLDLEEVEDEFTYWPLNLVLIVLGALTLGVAFFYLDPVDDRVIYNPWTYVVVTPLVLMIISFVLHTIVSRLVQKSMQMAFLLSVLVHLFFLIGAMNVVIFSRLWPDILESMAQERQQLRRENQQARQYYRITSTTKTGRRPDYLRFVPTQHQPTELELTTDQNLNLAQSTVNNLVTPVPEIARSANPHLIEREKATPSMAAASKNAAQFSKSSNQWRVESESTVPRMEANLMPEAPSELMAAEASARRQQDLTLSMPLNPALPPAQPSSSAAQQQQPIERNVAGIEQQANSMPEPSFPERAATASRESPIAESPRIAVRDSYPIQPMVRPVTPASRDTTPSRSRAIPSTLALPTEPTNQADQQRVFDMRRNETDRRLPDAQTGDFAVAARRQAAGGLAGSAAPSSLPIVGPESIASESQSQTQRVSPQLVVPSRRNGQATSSLSTSGLMQSPVWNGNLSLGGSLSGRSPSELSENAAQGNAVSRDLAGQSGQGRVIEKSMTGIAALQGMTGGPSVETSAQQVQQLDSEPAELAASGASLSRSGRSQNQSASMSPGGLTDSRQRASASQFPSGMARARATGQQPSSSSAIADAPRTIASSNAELASPSQGQIPLPGEGLASSERNAASNEPSQIEDGGRASRRGGASAANLLALNAPTGPGGIAPRTGSSGDLLPRRDRPIRMDRPTELEAQRFARSDVGGPLAAGKIAIPKPAFRQRIERLEDRLSRDATFAEPQTELAIERGLEFLAKHQRKDGSWRLQDFDTQVLMTSDTAATGLALLAFQGAGYTHKNFKYAKVCERAIRFLSAAQNPETGDLYVRQDPASDANAWLYSHAIGSLALCEAYGMTQDPELRAVAQRAVNFMVNSQDSRRGGWRYRPGVGSDTSVSGWFMMAFKSAELAGLTVPEQTYVLLAQFLERSQALNGEKYLYRYNPYAANTAQQRHGLQPTAVMTSVGLLMQLYSGWAREKPEMQAGADYLLKHLPELGTKQNSRRDTYYWYYSTQVMFHMGGETWRTWHDTLYPLLIKNQVVSGANEGSWNPMTPTPDLWARYGGRLYVTTMNLLSLEVSYRHLPLYEATAPSR